jgi:16S rRNA (adenine1518-N6/adenine1519-N6)-dimethyltransferase
MNPLPSLKDTIAHHQLKTKKKLGQHFLTDPQLLAKIVRVSGVSSATHVIEIGSGPGGVNTRIARKCGGERHRAGARRSLYPYFRGIAAARCTTA